MRLRCLVLSVALTLVGCSSTAEEPVDVNVGATGEAAQERSYRLPYPDPPYGSEIGAVIEDYRFLGWSRPAQAEFNADKIAPFSIAELYDPSGGKGIRYIVLTSTAVWCTVCRLEYDDFAAGRVDQYNERGVEFLGVLFEDNNNEPARPSDLELWAEAFDVQFPFVLDPSFKMGVFFDREATPMTMVIDASNMRILWIEVGWATDGDSSVWAFLDQILG